MKNGHQWKKQGWNVIKFNNCDCDDNKNDCISLNSDNGSIIVEPGTYIVTAACNIHKGNYSCILLENDDKSIQIYGSVSETCKVDSIGTSFILPQKIVIKSKTELILKLYCCDDGLIVGDSDVCFENNKSYGVGLSIKKVDL